jgi:hypothetical protein
VIILKIDGLRPLPEVGQYEFEDQTPYEVCHVTSGEAFDFYGVHWTVERRGGVWTRWDVKEDAEMCCMFWNKPRDQFGWWSCESTPLEGWEFVVDYRTRVHMIAEKIRSEKSNDLLLRSLLNGLDSWFLPSRERKNRHIPIVLADESTWEMVDGCWWGSCVEDRIEKGWFDHSAGVFREFVGPQRRPLSRDNADDLREVFGQGMEYTEMDTCGYISQYGSDIGYKDEDYSSWVDQDHTWKSATWVVHDSLDWTNAPQILKDIQKGKDEYQEMLVRNDLLTDDGDCDWPKYMEMKKNGELK